MRTVPVSECVKAPFAVEDGTPVYIPESSPARIVKPKAARYMTVTSLLAGRLDKASQHPREHERKDPRGYGLTVPDSPRCTDCSPATGL
jgi:hypothetical protein